MTRKDENITQYAVIGSQIRESLFSKIFPPPTKFSLTPESYPFVMSGSRGSGRRQLSLNLAINNIRHKSPFVFIDGSGDSSHYWDLYAAAEQLDKRENLYIINTLVFRKPEETSKISHTFDPLNSLVGNKQAFTTLFGSDIGNVIHSLCQCKKEAGERVSFDDLSNYISLRWLKESLLKSFYNNAHSEVRCYLDSNQNDTKHFINASKAMGFRETFEHSPCYSISPDIDFDEIFKQGKYLYIMLPSLERDPDALNVYATTMLLLLEQSRNYQKTDGLPNEFIQDALTYNADVQFFVESQKKSLTVYSLSCFHQPINMNYLAYKKIAEQSQSFLFMNQESGARAPKNIMEHLSRLHGFDGDAFEERLFQTRSLEGIAIGKITRIKNEKTQGAVNGYQPIKINPKALEKIKEATLSRSALLNHQ